jgi:DsbC/DsbD-like thiol-disulfide interchange protein
MLHCRSACLLLIGAACLLLTTAFLPAQKPAENSADAHAKLELISEKDAIVPHQPLRVGIRFDLQEGWHTYWVNPGDSGEAARIEWTLPAGFQAGSIEWPSPIRLSTPPFVDYGYEHQVLLPVVIQTPAGLTEGATQKIVAHVHYLVCREVCIPGQKQLSFELPVKNHSAASSNAGLFEATRRQLPKPIPEGWRISATSAGDEFRLRLRIGKAIASAQFFPLEAEQIENAAPQNVSAAPGGLDLHLKKSNHLLKPISRLKGVIVVAGTAYLIDVPVV